MKAYFNLTALRKDITRFAPLWGLYTAFMLLMLLLLWESMGTSAYLMNQSESILGMMGMVNFCYAGLCALLLFSDLFTPRLCNMLHALPLRREGWFLTHITAGLLFCIVPNLLGAGIAAAMLGTYAYGALLWLALTVLQFLFFFGLGVFSVFCAGHAMGAITVYAVINFFSALVSFLLTTFYEPLLYGVTINTQTLTRMGSPVVYFTGSPFIETSYDNMKSITIVEDIPAEGWIYAGVAAGIGVVLLGLALLLYRKRKLESAGDIIAWKPVEPVILVVYTLLFSALLYYISHEMVGTLGYVFLLAGLAIGFFTGCMALEKRVNVFRGKNFIGFAILTVVFGISMGATALDPVGITRYVPDAEQVEYVSVSPYATFYSINEQSCILTEQEDIAAVQQLHRDAISNRPDGLTTCYPVCLRYTLKNGKTVSREYQLMESLGYEPLLHSYYSRPGCVLGTDDIHVLMNHTSRLEFYPYEDSSKLPYIYIARQMEGVMPEEKYGEDAAHITEVETGSFATNTTVTKIMEAVYQDCLAGTMSQYEWSSEKNAVGYLQLEIAYGQYHEYLDIYIYDNSANTLKALEELAAQ